VDQQEYLNGNELISGVNHKHYTVLSMFTRIRKCKCSGEREESPESLRTTTFGTWTGKHADFL